MHRVLLALVGGSLFALACRTADVASQTARGDTRAIVVTIQELYRAFCFDAGDEADWDAIRALAAEGAVFVAPIAEGKTPRAVGIEDFLRDFQSYVASDAVRATGLHERITHTRIDAFGHVAHAYVVFEGFLPGTNETVSRGLDSIQLVLDGERWKVVSFTTQYESAGRLLPARFMAEPCFVGACGMGR